MIPPIIRVVQFTYQDREFDGSHLVNKCDQCLDEPFGDSVVEFVMDCSDGKDVRVVCYSLCNHCLGVLIAKLHREYQIEGITP